MNFLNIHLENQHGYLHTSIDRDSNAQSCLLPYVMSGHPSLSYGQYFRLALIRAICYCSNVYDFDQERLSIELTFVRNGFPLEIIEQYLRNFLIKYKMQSLQTNLDQTIYNRIRRQLFLLFLDKQQQQQQEIKHRSFHFYYLYEWGPRRQFNKEFQRLWSHYIKAYPMLPKDLGQINLTTRYLHSLNTLLAQEKKPSEISSKKKK